MTGCYFLFLAPDRGITEVNELEAVEIFATVNGCRKLLISVHSLGFVLRWFCLCLLAVDAMCQLAWSTQLNGQLEQLTY